MADVCLLLEGTFPYVTGGVSTCVYQLIKNTPNILYSVVFIGSKYDPQAKYKYEIPDNIVNIQEIFLHDIDINPTLKKIGPRLNKERIQSIFQNPLEKRKENFAFLFEHLINESTRVCHPYQFICSKEIWDILNNLYPKEGPLPSFVDYFYTSRFSLLPIINVLLTKLPKVRLYHALCTGYAGLLGALGKMKYHKPFFLTEHGIYTHERDIEIADADWIHSDDSGIIAQEETTFFKRWWIKLFNILSIIAYDQADAISTLYQGNQLKQIQYGAAPEKLMIIPNGIRISDFSKPLIKDKKTFNIGLVGRVVPIKDIKCFIKAVRFAVDEIPNLQAFIYGPTDEDEGYFKECQSLVQFFELEQVITFTGRVNVKDVYPQLDLNILSSISEGQPMVILETYCLGIPSVSTDVGGCSEMIYGRTEEDQRLGKSGEIVPLGKPEELAKAIVSILSNKERWQRMSDTAKTRVERYYQESQTIQQYHAVYQRLMAGAKI